MNFELYKALNKAIYMVKKDIIDRIVRGEQLNKRPYTPNAESTAKIKGFNRRLIAKEKRFVNSNNYKIKKATKGNQVASLSFSNDEDAEIAMYNQAPTGAGKIKPKDKVVFWGISEDVEKEVLEDMDIEINREVDKEIESWGFKKV